MFKICLAGHTQIRYTKDKCIIVFILNEFTVQGKTHFGRGWLDESYIVFSSI